MHRPLFPHPLILQQTKESLHNAARMLQVAEPRAFLHWEIGAEHLQVFIEDIRKELRISALAMQHSDRHHSHHQLLPSQQNLVLALSLRRVFQQLHHHADHFLVLIGVRRNQTRSLRSAKLTTNTEKRTDTRSRPEAASSNHASTRRLPPYPCSPPCGSPQSLPDKPSIGRAPSKHHMHCFRGLGTSGRLQIQSCCTVCKRLTFLPAPLSSHIPDMAPFRVRGKLRTPFVPILHVKRSSGLPAQYEQGLTNSVNGTGTDWVPAEKGGCDSWNCQGEGGMPIFGEESGILESEVSLQTAERASNVFWREMT